MTIALITGGNRGLGRAAAVALARTGTDIVFTWRSDEAEAAGVVAELEAIGVRAAALRLDTSAPSTFADFVETLRGTLHERFGAEHLDVLINNAGNSGEKPFGALDEAEIDRLYRVHVLGVMLLTQAVEPLLADGGRVLNVSTGLTQNLVNPVYAVYAAMKGAVEVWTKYLAKDLGARGIAVNIIAPGATATDFGGGAVRDNEGYQTAISATSAMGRVGQPEDIGGAIAALLAPSAAWITGQRIEASGGQGMGRGIRG
jgi:NAD(P)-dependent dehydrogenase (short-subunit alcohol dehydrogenase family)